jgi:AcrR family transcriptional regulator
VTAVRETLDEVGYNALTIDGVASRAGVGRPTIYRRWPSKAALVIGALGEPAHADHPIPDTGRLRDDLLEIRRRLLAMLRSPEGQRVLPGLVADLTDHPELYPRFYDRYVGPWREAIQEAVDRAIRRKEVPDDPSGRLVADVLAGPLIFRVLFAHEEVNEKSLEAAVDLVLAGLMGEAGGDDYAERRGAERAEAS